MGFLRTHVTSLLQLEALLLVFESGREPRSAADLAAQMYIPAGPIDDWLSTFADVGFCDRHADGFRAPGADERFALIASVADCYVRRRISVQQIIFARRDTPAASFADAFRFRKEP